MSHQGYPERTAWRRGGSKPCPGSPRTIEVLVETLTGSAFEMTVSPLDTVLAIKSKIYRVEGIPISQQHLLYKLKELDNSLSLQEQQIWDGATLRLVVAMRGGPISMHRLPPPSAHWRDVDRQDAQLESSSKVTVLLVRDGANVNMLRVSDDDATYSAVRRFNNNRAARAREAGGTDEAGLAENRVTANKMLELRRRMQSLGLHSRHSRHEVEEASCMQKTRSEEILSSPSELLEPLTSASHYQLDQSDTLLCASHYQHDETMPCSSHYQHDAMPQLLDGNYTRYDYECSFADRYTLLPPITADSEQSSGEDDHVSLSGERIKLSDALAGSILVKSGRGGKGEAGDEGCGVVADPVAKKLLAHTALPALPAQQYGPLVGCEMSPAWRVRAFGSSSHLAAPGPLAPAHSASSLPPAPPSLGDPLLSSSTSDLEKLKRSRPLPTLCRHRNRENLDLSDDRLDTPAKHCLEVGSERRHRRIRKIAELQRAETSTPAPDDGREPTVRKPPNDALAERSEPPPSTPPPPAAAAKRAGRTRCGLCRKRLGISTAHSCRCGGEFCAPHRYAEAHGCAYDYKAQAQRQLQRANPLVSAPKLPKI